MSCRAIPISRTRDRQPACGADVAITRRLQGFNMNTPYFLSQNITRLTALLLTLGLGHYSGSLYAAPAQGEAPASTARPVLGALNAGQLSQIQVLGRAVLAAKGSQQASSEELALQNDLHTLAASIDQALKVSQPSLTLSIAKPAAGATGVSTNAQSDASKVRRAQTDNKLNTQLANLHRHRQNINALVPAGDETSRERIGHVQQIAKRIEPIELSVQEALAEPDDAKRFAKLVALKQKLRPRSLGQWWRDQEEEARLAGTAAPLPPTSPTLTTLTQHRAGLDDVGANGNSPPTTTNSTKGKR